MAKNLVVELATELRGLKTQKEEISASSKLVNKRIEEIEKQLLPDAMDAEGISNIKIDDVGRVTLRGEVYASILAANRYEAFQWLRDTGRGSLISETVSASSLKAAAKAWLKSGEKIPESLIKVTPVTIATLSKT